MSVAITPAPSRGITIALWALQILLAAAFLAAAGAKLAGLPEMVAEFDTIGLGQWLRYAAALVEVVGGVALLVPGLAGPGALLLGVEMIFAALAHLVFLHNNPAPAVVLGVLSFLLAWGRWGQVRKNLVF